MKVVKEVMVDRAKRERHTISNSVYIYIHVYNHTMLFRKKIDYNVTLPWVLKQVKC